MAQGDRAHRGPSGREDLVLKRDRVLTTDHASYRGQVKDLVPDRDSESSIDRVSEKSLWTTKRVQGPPKNLQTIKESTDYKRVYGL